MLLPRTLTALLGAGCLACSAPVPSAAEAVRGFVAAVQSQDLERLSCLSAAGPTDGFENWALGQYEAYLTGRDAGAVELDGSGIVLVKLLALGRGTFQRLGLEFQTDDGGREIEGEVRLGYAHVDLSRFTPGTVIYFAGAPPGRVHQLRVPSFSREISLDVLDAAAITWTMVWRDARQQCPDGWAVASVRVKDGSVGTEEVTWVF